MINPGKLALVLVALYALLLAAAAGGAAAFWADLDQVERTHAAEILLPRASLLVLVVLAVFVALGYLVRLLFQRYVTSPLELAQATRIITSANPSLRLELKGGPELRQLGQAINAFADQHEALRRDVEARIREAQADLQEERDRLSALISELTQSVLVCNVEGRILLYNARARGLLGQPVAGHPGGGAGLVGLGRSVFAVIDRSLVAHALESLRARLGRGEESPVASLVTTTAAGQLVRVQVTPVRAAPSPGGAEDRGAAFSGFVLLVEDVTRAVETGARAGEVLEALLDASRRGLASIRAAAESLLAHPEMEPAMKGRFLDVVHQEATGLSAKVDQAAGQAAASLGAAWLLEEMLGADLLEAVQARLERDLGQEASLQEVDRTLWVNVDSYALVQALTHLAGRLREECGARALQLSLRPSGRLAQLDLAWDGAAAGPEQLARWEAEPLSGGGRDRSSLRQVMERHGGALWHQAQPGRANRFLFLLPASRHGPAPAPPAPSAPGRPEAYDFDLFHQAGQSAELDRRPLAALSYTVFDTETTGLRPSEGDEIISIGAVRVVNGRLLRHEAFEQLVDPGRPVPAEAVRITGIQGAMLRGQPTIAQVLPAFHAFCEDTVLVAHNAAFDLRFLELKEGATGVRFGHPVLDTLLLSAVVQPDLASGNLERIAALYGVDVIGRHTSLGDAIMTAEILLRMIPVLAERGIVTLGEARLACERTLRARLRY